MCKVSVIMSCFNEEQYISDSIKSILSQTFEDFELIIVDDASRDKTAEIVRSFQDKRIVFLQNDENRKLSFCLNLAISVSKGEYLARMDADDFSDKYRLEKQVKYLNDNPDVGVVGSWIELFGSKQGVAEYPQNHKDIYYDFIAPNKTVAHPAVMIRKEVMTKFGISYDEKFDVAQDYELWNQLKHVCKIVNIPEVLLKYRIHVNSTTSTKRQRQIELFNLVRKKELDILLRRSASKAEIDIIIYKDVKNVSLIRLLVTLYLCRKGLYFRHYKWFFISFLKAKFI